jgi:hypothetical protein
MPGVKPSPGDKLHRRGERQLDPPPDTFGEQPVHPSCHTRHHHRRHGDEDQGDGECRGESEIAEETLLLGFPGCLFAIG